MGAAGETAAPRNTRSATAEIKRASRGSNRRRGCCGVSPPHQVGNRGIDRVPVGTGQIEGAGVRHPATLALRPPRADFSGQCLVVQGEPEHAARTAPAGELPSRREDHPRTRCDPDPASPEQVLARGIDRQVQGQGPEGAPNRLTKRDAVPSQGDALPDQDMPFEGEPADAMHHPRMLAVGSPDELAHLVEVVGEERRRVGRRGRQPEALGRHERVVGSGRCDLTSRAWQPESLSPAARRDVRNDPTALHHFGTPSRLATERRTLRGYPTSAEASAP